MITGNDVLNCSIISSARFVNRPPQSFIYTSTPFLNFLHSVSIKQELLVIRRTTVKINVSALPVIPATINPTNAIDRIQEAHTETVFSRDRYGRLRSCRR